MFTVVAWIFLGMASLCSIVITMNEIRHPQKMRTMSIFRPVTGLHFSVVVLWGYYRIGRAMIRRPTQDMSGET